MNWAKVNLALVIGCAVVTVFSVVLWVVAWWFDFIGDTRFIGHVSMLALVLGAASTFTGAMASWRSDVPTDYPPGEE